MARTRSILLTGLAALALLGASTPARADASAGSMAEANDVEPVAFSSMDRDGDNRLSWQEFLEGLAATNETVGTAGAAALPPRDLMALRKAFEKMDANRDHAVSDIEHAHSQSPELVDEKEPPKKPKKRNRSVKSLLGWGRSVNSRIVRATKSAQKVADAQRTAEAERSKVEKEIAAKKTEPWFRRKDASASAASKAATTKSTPTAKAAPAAPSSKPASRKLPAP